MTIGEIREEIKGWISVILGIGLLVLCLYGYMYLDQMRISYRALQWAQTVNNQIITLNKQVKELSDTAVGKEIKDGQTKK